MEVTAVEFSLWFFCGYVLPMVLGFLLSLLWLRYCRRHSDLDDHADALEVDTLGDFNDWIGPATNYMYPWLSFVPIGNIIAMFIMMVGISGFYISDAYEYLMKHIHV